MTGDEQGDKRSDTLLLHLASVGLVALVIIAVTILALQKDIPSDAVVGLFGTAIGAGGNAAAGHRLPWNRP